jgi:hypothetical protein
MTGLSIDDQPITPRLTDDGRWLCPVDGREVVRLRTGSWTHKPSRAFLDAFGVTLEQQLEDEAVEDETQGLGR